MHLNITQQHKTLTQMCTSASSQTGQIGFEHQAKAQTQMGPSASSQTAQIGFKPQLLNPSISLLNPPLFNINAPFTTNLPSLNNASYQRNTNGNAQQMYWNQRNYHLHCNQNQNQSDNKYFKR